MIEGEQSTFSSWERYSRHAAGISQHLMKRRSKHMSFTSDLSDGFFDTLKDICTRLGCEPIDLLSVMM
jgi:thiamine monophosphate kinase